MKKLFAIVLAVAMCLGMMAVVASAADDVYIVAGTSNMCGSEWNPSDTNNQMTTADGGATYRKTYENLPAGSYEFKVTKNKGWTAAYPGSNFKFTLSATETVTVVFTVATTTVTVEYGSGDVYVVAGVAALCGSAWNGSDTNNQMTPNADKSVYTKVYTNVAAGDYQFKIVKNGAQWIPDPGDNKWFKVEGTSDVTITYTVATGAIDITQSAASGGEEEPEKPADTYVVAGSEALCGSNWNGTDTNNQLTPNADNTVYSKTYTNVAPGKYEFKIVKNGVQWIPDGTGNNQTFTVGRACDVTITFTVEGSKIEITGDGLGEVKAPAIEYMAIVGEGLDTLDWDPAGKKNVMTKTAEGIYEYTFENVQSDWISFKLTANGNWDDYNIGGTFAASGEVFDLTVGGNPANIGFKVTETSNVHVKLDLTGLNYTEGTGAKMTITITKVQTQEPEQPVEPEVPTETVTVYAKVPESWAGVNLYAWNAEGFVVAWPGSAMEKGEDGWYSIQIPAWVDHIIVNYDGVQTQDIELDATKGEAWVVVTVTDAGCIGEVGYEAPKTGDGTNMIALVAAMLGAAAGVVGTIAMRKKFN